MQRIPEPELMDEPVQAAAYANADFAEPHNHFIDLFCEVITPRGVSGLVLDLGCGPADISIRFAKTFPECVIHAIDGAAYMLEQGRARIANERLEERIHLFQGFIPEFQLPHSNYSYIISNSLLHHLHNPDALWQYIRKYANHASHIFVMDLMRPESPEEALELVTAYSGSEPEILRRDFFNSLCAAFTPEELKAQLLNNGLNSLDLEIISDRHMIIFGKIQDAQK